MKKRKICVVTGTRAEYGLLSSLMKLMREDPAITLQVVITGSHLSERFGNTFRQIEADGFRIDERIPILSDHDTTVDVTEAMGRALRGFAKALNRLDPDLIVLLGDRYEIHAVASAALIAKVPVAHIAGGDITEGAFDNALRHAITKMSHLHFVTNIDSARRVTQMGEDPKRIYIVGNPALDVLRDMAFLTREQVE